MLGVKNAIVLDGKIVYECRHIKIRFEIEKYDLIKEYEARAHTW